MGQRNLTSKPLQGSPSGSGQENGGRTIVFSFFFNSFLSVSVIKPNVFLFKNVFDYFKIEWNSGFQEAFFVVPYFYLLSKKQIRPNSQGLPSRLVRHLIIHCLKQLRRHQVKNSFNNLCFPAVGHIMTVYKKIITNKGRGLIPYKRTTVSTHAFFYISVKSSLFYLVLQ